MKKSEKKGEKSEKRGKNLFIGTLHLELWLDPANHTASHKQRTTNYTASFSSCQCLRAWPKSTTSNSSNRAATTLWADAGQSNSSSSSTCAR